MTQFKEKSAGEQRERVGTGLLTYPALMAADILLYDTNFVPVGEDQRQHIEFTRDLGQRVNQRFGDVFVLPEPLIAKAGARIMGLDDPERKMSKTLAQNNPGHAIFLTDPPDVIRKKFARAQTDAEPAVRFPAGPGVRNLLEIYRSVTEVSPEAVEQKFVGKSYAELKQTVAEATIAALSPIQERYREIRSDYAGLTAQLRAAADRLMPIANRTLHRVHQAVGLR
jgi:tryptophanyl-tRNA synthetase